jgi:hypothetical protein
MGKRKFTKLSKKQIATLARKIAALNVQEQSDDPEHEPVDDAAPPAKRQKTVTNRTHPATTRQS